MKAELNELSDRDLLADYAKRGDQTAFAELVRRHKPMVETCCSRILWDKGTIREDAVQCVFIVFAGKAASISECENLGGWLYRAAVLTCRNLARSEDRRKAREDLAVKQVEPAEPPSNQWIEARRFLDDAVRELSIAQQVAVVRHYFENVSCDRIAVELGCTEGTVRTHLQRARQKLFKELKRERVELSMVALVAGLESESKELPIGDLGLPIGDGKEMPEGIRNTADAVMSEMGRTAAKAMWWKIGAVAAGLATVGVGTALVASHLQSATVEPATSWRIESVIGAPIVRRVETTRLLKAGDVLCEGDRIVTVSNQEVQVVSDVGDRVLLREEGEVRFEHSTSNIEHRTLKLGEGDSQVRVVYGVVVAQVKHPARFMTPHAGVETSGADFLLMVASGLTTNGAPWSFSRIDVTEGQGRLRSSGTQVSSSEFPVSSHQFAAAGTDFEGNTIETVARKSDGRELSPKYGGCFFRKYVEFYCRERKAVGEVEALKPGQLLKEWSASSFAEQAVLKNMQTPEIVKSNGKTAARFIPSKSKTFIPVPVPASLQFSAGPETVADHVLELDIKIEIDANLGLNRYTFVYKSPEMKPFAAQGTAFVMPWLFATELGDVNGKWIDLRLSRVVVGQLPTGTMLQENVMISNGRTFQRQWGSDSQPHFIAEVTDIRMDVAQVRLRAIE